MSTVSTLVMIFRVWHFICWWYHQCFVWYHCCPLILSIFLVQTKFPPTYLPPSISSKPTTTYYIRTVQYLIQNNAASCCMLVRTPISIWVKYITYYLFTAYSYSPERISISQYQLVRYRNQFISLFNPREDLRPLVHPQTTELVRYLNYRYVW